MRHSLGTVWIASVSFFCIASVAFCQDLVCHWATSPIVIDGQANESAWNNAQVIDHFRIPATVKNVPATSTKAR